MVILCPFRSSCWSIALNEWILVSYFGYLLRCKHQCVCLRVCFDSIGSHKRNLCNLFSGQVRPSVLSVNACTVYTSSGSIEMRLCERGMHSKCIGRIVKNPIWLAVCAWVAENNRAKRNKGLYENMLHQFILPSLTIKPSEKWQNWNMCRAKADVNGRSL